MLRVRFVVAAVAFFGTAPLTLAGPVRAGFDSVNFPGNDDGSVGPVAIGFGANFFGTTYNQLHVNNNGNVTFNGPLGTFTPFALNGATANPIIAAFFADVDTRTGNTTRYGNGTVNGRNTFGVSWRDVGYFSNHVDKLNTFQLLLIDRSDTGVGNFDIEFNYDKIQWETGDASGGVGGLGGTSAAVGFSNGSGLAGTNFQLPGSLVNGAFLDSGPAGTRLIGNRLNSDMDGRYLFTVRGGVVIVAIPETATLAVLGFGVVGLVGLRRRLGRA